MAYGQKSSTDLLAYAKAKNATIVDLRSDTVSKPSESMRLAMYKAEVGDDVYGEDPTIKRLEEKAAAILGKEAAMFVTSGTMANLIAIMNHCDVRGSEAYCGEESHTILHEQGGAAQIAGVSLFPIANNHDGTFDLQKLEKIIRKDSLHEPISKLVIVENTINGKIVPQSWIKNLAKLAKYYNLKLHMDGARMWNAAIASKLSPAEIVSGFDSVCFCLSKGLGAPVGSLLCGTESFIAKARRIRKVLGGGMRQAGVLAAAGLVALDEIVPLLNEDHRRASLLAKAINDINSKKFFVDPSTVQTNIIFMNIVSEDFTARDFLERLQSVDEDAEDDRVIVRGLTLGSNSIRFVFYYEIGDDLLQAAIQKIKKVIKLFDTHL